MQAFEYASPTTLREALPLLGSKWGEVEILAGGTDLLALMKDHVENPRRLVNIKGIAALGGIRKTPAGLRIGAVVTLDELLRSAAIKSDYPAIASAAEGVASQQIRNMGTAGGDLCQRPRCWYYRRGHGLLAKGSDGQSLVPRGENRYHAIFGNKGPAYFVSASSFGPPLVALGAKVTLTSATGTREVEVEKFFVTPADDSTREIALEPGEILTEIVIPPAAGVRNATYEIRHKTALDWPLATASVALHIKGTTVESGSIVLGHVAPTPWRAVAAEQALAGKAITEQTAMQIANAAAEGASPLSGNAYKVQLVRTAVKRALMDAVKA